MTKERKVKGYTAGKRTRIAVSFDDQKLFGKLTRRAEITKVSMNTLLVDLIKCGLRDIEDSERHEANPDDRIVDRIRCH